MRNLFRKAMALLLVLTVAAAVFGCSSTSYKEALVGKWECQESFTGEEMSDLLSATFYDEEMAVISIEGLSFTKVVEFCEDDTYSFSYNGEACRESVRGFYAEAIEDLYAGRLGLTELYGDVVAEMTLPDFEQAYAELLGYSDFDDMLDGLTDALFDAAELAEPFETGTYKALKGRILTTITGETTEEYLEYTLEGENLTLTYIDAAEEYTRAN